MKPTIVLSDLVETIPLTSSGNLPCPFCGGITLSRLRPHNDSEHGWIECETCGATGPNHSAEHCASAWNARSHGPEIFIRLGDSQWLNHLTEPQMKQFEALLESISPVAPQPPATLL